MRPSVKRLFLIVASIALVWAGGFATFLHRIPEASGAPSSLPPQAGTADGVVVFTGEGVRVSSAFDLFGAGVGQRLLISGVHPDTSLNELAHLYAGDPARFDCCIDLGRTAQTTRGNASETEAWAGEHGFAVVLLVTSDYHMPRAIAETRRRMPEIEIIPFVTTSSLIDHGEPAGFAALMPLASEFNKFIIADLSRRLAALGRFF